MGQSTTETVRKIEQTRERLSEDLDELEERLPAATKTAKMAARIATGTGVAGTIFWFVVRRMRARGRTRQQQAAQRPIRVEFQLVPDRWSEALEDPRTRQWIAGAAGAWALLRLLELRQLRRLRKAYGT